jgi:hypothetical protein
MAGCCSTLLCRRVPGAVTSTEIADDGLNAACVVMGLEVTFSNAGSQEPEHTHTSGPPTRNRCSEGIGEGREQHAPRAPRLVFIRASMRLHKPPCTCALGVWAVACACVCVGVYARAWAGRASKRCGAKRVWGKQTVPSLGTFGLCVCVQVRLQFFILAPLRASL